MVPDLPGHSQRELNKPLTHVNTTRPAAVSSQKQAFENLPCVPGPSAMPGFVPWLSHGPNPNNHDRLALGFGS